MKTTNYLAISIFLLLASCARAQDAKPITLPLRALGLDEYHRTLAVSDDARRAYFGKWYSDDPKRLNIGVLTLDENGRPVGAPRFYKDTEIAVRQQPEAQTMIGAILPDSKRKKLYLSYVPDTYRSSETKLLSVYDLNAEGEPIGKPRSYEVGNPNRSILKMALHPTKNVLYMTGWGGAGVYAYQLDDKGEPQGEVKSFGVGNNGKYEIAVGDDGKKLYLGSYPDVMEVVNLDDTGMPSGEQRSSNAGKEEIYLNFQYTPQMLYLVRKTPDGLRLATWKLNADGYPEGKLKIHDDIAINAPVLSHSSPLMVDAKHRRLWVASNADFTDVFTGKSVVDGAAPIYFSLDPDGTPRTPSTRFPTQIRQKPVAFALAKNGAPALSTEAMAGGFLGNRIKDYRLRVTLLEAEPKKGAAPPAFRVTISIPGKEAQYADGVVVGKPSPWIDLNALLRDEMGPLVGRLQVGNGEMSHVRAKIELAQTASATEGTPLKTLTEDVLGGLMIFFLPGYGYEPFEKRVDAMYLVSDHADRYVAAARKVALKPEEKPRKFIVSSYMMLGGQASVPQLKKYAETLGLMGFNTAHVYGWNNIPPTQIDEICDSHGIVNRTLASYTPPSYFDFEKDKMNPAALDKWVKDLADQLGPENGGSLADVREYFMADEPGWYYPYLFDVLKEKPERLQLFHDYLKAQGLQPADLGEDDWKGVLPIGASVGSKPDAPLAQRKLFYHTIRFFTDSATRGFKMSRDAIERHFKRQMPSVVNWNNSGIWYTASPNKKIANNWIVNSDSAMGAPDWFDAARHNSNRLWTEDWFKDKDAQTWSYYGDMMRSAAMESKADGKPQNASDIGSYVIGAMTGSFPSGTSYKVMSLVGHGAKHFSFFAWGPEFLFPGNCWSENFHAYAPIASAIKMLGRGERLLYPGRPARGKVAILLPSISRLWEQDNHWPLYEQEYRGLHHALIHAGYTVDFVDDKTLSDDGWRMRGYSTLYITSPNISQHAQKQIAAWTKAGGTLVSTPGAGTADEYNTPTKTLDEVLGLQNREAVRDAMPLENGKHPETSTLTLTNAKLGKGAMAVRGPITKLQPTHAAIMATLKNNEPGVTASTHGKGRAISYAFFPGWQYWLTPQRIDPYLPKNWGASQRALAVAAPRIARTQKDVTLSEEVVEACRLQSDKGIAIVLLNWKDEPVKSLTVAIPRAGKFRKVTSLETGTVKSTAVGDTLKLTVSLKNVDVLMIE